MIGDGPVAQGECCDCGMKFKEDVYRYKGRILCGECRYVARHKQMPPRACPPAVQLVRASVVYNGRNDSLHGNRYDVLQAKTTRHAEVLSQWIADARLSLE